MGENLHYESVVYFKEPHNEQEYYWPTIYRTGAAVVLDVTKTRNAERKSGKVHEEQKGNRETTQRMGNKVTDRAKVGSCFSFSHFRVRSLFFIPRFSSILACGHKRWRDRKYVCVRRLVAFRITCWVSERFFSAFDKAVNLICELSVSVSGLNRLSSIRLPSIS